MNVAVALEVPEDVTKQALSIVDEANAIVVETSEDYAKASKISNAIKPLQDLIAEKLDPAINQAHKAHKAMLAVKKEQLDPLDEAVKTIHDKMEAWYAAEQRKKAEAERVRQEAERKRIEEERLAEAERKEKEAAELREQNRIEEAEVAEKEAEAVIEEEVVVEEKKPEPVMESPVGGHSRRETYKAEVTDMTLFVKAVADGSAPGGIGLLKVNESALNTMARVQKKNLKIPGVRVYTEAVHTRR